MDELIHRFHKDDYVVEYSAKKEEIHKMVFELPDGKGTRIWEPLSTWETNFDK